MSTVRKGCINKGEDASDPAVLKEWADRGGIKRATKEVWEAKAYHKASPDGKIKMRIGWARMLGERASITELEAELADLESLSPSPQPSPRRSR
jgi:hypothetical protein